MNAKLFFTKVKDHRDLDWLGSKQGKSPRDDEVFIEFIPTGAKIALPIQTIQEFEWEDLEPVLTLKRMIRLLKNFTRIVGYYSSTHNWNRSKIAELIDRRKGMYYVDDCPVSTGGTDVKDEETPARSLAVAHI